MKDMNGEEFKVGQFVVKAYDTGDLRIMKVSKIIGDNVYLGKSTNALIYPESVLILCANAIPGGDCRCFRRWKWVRHPHPLFLIGYRLPVYTSSLLIIFSRDLRCQTFWRWCLGLFVSGDKFSDWI